MRALARSLAAVSSALNRAALVGAVAAVAVMIFAAGYQVIARYVFDAPPVWTEELARRAMVWAGMLGASAAFHERSDPNLFPAALGVSGGLGHALAIVRALGVVIFVVLVLYYCLFGPNMSFARGFIGRSLARKAEMIDLSMVWFTAAVPVAFALVLVHLVAQLAGHLSGLTAPEPGKQDELPI